MTPAPSRRRADAAPRLLLAYSGGLDTSFLVAWLTRERGWDVSTLYVDCGGLSAGEAQAIEARALAFGAREHRTLDARPALFARVLRWLIAGNVRRGGTYPLCVAAERGLQAEALAECAREGGYEAVAHGSTGAGNDQVRFEAALSVVAEGLQVLAPIRDEGFGRTAEAAWLAQQGLALPASNARYSVNAGLWGLTIGGGELKGSSEPLPEHAWQWTRDAQLTEPALLELEFARGLPVALDGTACEPVALIETLNRRAGRLGVGRGYHLGDTVLGIKGRIAYEAPAAEVVLCAHRELEKLVLTEDQRMHKDQLGELYGRRLHQGLLHEPFLRDVEALFASSQERVSGTVRVRLSGGRALVEGLSSPFSMLSASDARYGERPAAQSNPSGAAWLARTLAEPARLSRRAQERARLAGALPLQELP
jgi:argininosuccinate synthase